jgi:uncharacterized membrane protein
MPTWIIFGIIASLCWGAYAVVSKVAISEKYFGINSAWAALFMLIGIAIVFIFNVIKEGVPMPTSKGGISFAIFAGFIWALGIYFSLKAISIGADVSKLTPLYNTNTLIAVLLGILLLHELPKAADAIRVIIGAILIVVGAILTSL